MTSRIIVTEESSPDSVTVVVGGQKKYCATPGGLPATLRELLNAIYDKAGMEALPAGELAEGNLTIISRGEDDQVVTHAPTRDVEAQVSPGAQVVASKNFMMGGIRVTEEPVATGATVIVGGQKKYTAFTENEEAVPLRELLNAIYAAAGLAQLPEGQTLAEGNVTIISRDEDGTVVTNAPTRNVDTPVACGDQVIASKNFMMGR